MIKKKRNKMNRNEIERTRRRKSEGGNGLYLLSILPPFSTGQTDSLFGLSRSPRLISCLFLASQIDSKSGPKIKNRGGRKRIEPF